MEFRTCSEKNANPNVCFTKAPPCEVVRNTAQLEKPQKTRRNSSFQFTQIATNSNDEVMLPVFWWVCFSTKTRNFPKEMCQLFQSPVRLAADLVWISDEFPSFASISSWITSRTQDIEEKKGTCRMPMGISIEFLPRHRHHVHCSGSFWKLEALYDGFFHPNLVASAG